MSSPSFTVWKNSVVFPTAWLIASSRYPITAAADVEVSGARVHVWGVRDGDTVLGIEIMAYRETYGDRVRLPHWCTQFVGKGVADVMRLERDIRNISGAW